MQRTVKPKTIWKDPEGNYYFVDRIEKANGRVLVVYRKITLGSMEGQKKRTIAAFLGFNASGEPRFTLVEAAIDMNHPDVVFAGEKRKVNLNLVFARLSDLTVRYDRHSGTMDIIQQSDLDKAILEICEWFLLEASSFRTFPYDAAINGLRRILQRHSKIDNAFIQISGLIQELKEIR